MKTDSKVVVSIVNWNGIEYLPTCIESLREQTEQNFEIIIVDNNSSDGSVAWLKENCPEIRLIENDGNTGFSFAHNQAIKDSRSEYVLVLNFDILLEPEFLARTIKAMDKRPDVGMVSGKLLKLINGEKTDTIDSTGIIMPRCMQAARGEMEKDKGQYDNPENCDIFGPCGAAPLYRRAMLEDIAYEGEYFDEDFVYYVEDVDLAWRGQLAGWKAIYESSAVGYHERGATRKNSKDISFDYLVIGMGNRLCGIYKNMPAKYTLYHFIKFTAFESGALFIKHSYPYSVNFRALLRFLRLLPKMHKKRKFIQRKVKISPSTLEQYFDYNNFNLARQFMMRSRAFTVRPINILRRLYHFLRPGIHRTILHTRRFTTYLTRAVKGK